MIALFVIGFNRPDLLREQKRLLDKNLQDEFTLSVIDNTPNEQGQRGMRETCASLGIPYRVSRSIKHLHHEALNQAAYLADDAQHDWWGCIDHDVFCAAPCSLIDKVKVAGFYGLAQTYAPRVGTPLRYLWPGFVFFSREWLNSRVPNFNGIRGEHRFDDGDTGSELHALFSEEDWARAPQVAHGYGTIRPDDGHGLQSYGFERVDGFVHLSNASRWKAVPRVEEREQMLREMVAEL